MNNSRTAAPEKPRAPNRLTDETHVATALVVLQAACAARLNSKLSVAAMGMTVSPSLQLIHLCQQIAADDPLAVIAATALSEFYQPDSLDRHRISLDEDRLRRTIAALATAIAAGNHAAAETLLRRGLNQLIAPLRVTTSVWAS